LTSKHLQETYQTIKAIGKIKDMAIEIGKSVWISGVSQAVLSTINNL
jgi:hypothetical protein